jgi:phage-related protein
LQKTGYQIDRVQNGLAPDNFKPMTTVGTSVYEIRVEDQSGAFRVIYIAKFEQCVYVLHAFVKKTTKTSKQDIELAAGRYKALMKQRSTK